MFGDILIMEKFCNADNTVPLNIFIFVVELISSNTPAATFSLVRSCDPFILLGQIRPHNQPQILIELNILIIISVKRTFSLY